jgi:hypothetical protein
VPDLTVAGPGGGVYQNEKAPPEDAGRVGSVMAPHAASCRSQRSGPGRPRPRGLVYGRLSLAAADVAKRGDQIIEGIRVLVEQHLAAILARAVNDTHNSIIMTLTRMRQNLLALIESGAWDKS